MAIPTIRAGFPLNDEAAASTATISGTLPAGSASGDIVLVAVEHASATATMSTPAGWSVLAGPTRNGTNFSGWLYGRKLGAGEAGSTVSFTASAADIRFVGEGVVVAGADTLAELVIATPSVVTATQTSFGTPVQTAPENDCALVNFWLLRSALATAPTLTTPAPFTKDGEANTANVASPNISVTAAHRTAGAPVAGTNYGNANGVSSQSSQAIVYGILLTPAVAPNVAPTANAGADQTGVEPWSAVTLTGTDSDSDGTIASRSWTQTAGSPAVTLSGSGASRTFAAPATIAGTTLTFSYSVTDNGGATTADTMTVAVLPVTERAVIGGVEVPMQIRTT